jgi:hypothetical protein
VVAPSASPDLVWDPATRDVIARGDVVAKNVTQADLGGVIERTATVRALKTRIARAPLSIRMLPNDGLHRAGERVEVEIKGVRNRALTLFNIAGDGTIQLLYPAPGEPAVLQSDTFKLQVQVVGPYGADQLVAVSSGQPLLEFQQELLLLGRRRAPSRVLDLLDRTSGPTASIGAVGLFTAP